MADRPAPRATRHVCGRLTYYRDRAREGWVIEDTGTGAELGFAATRRALLQVMHFLITGVWHD